MSTRLPVEDVVGDVRTALADHGAAVLVAAPGAGKTTVVPLRLLDEPWAASGRLLLLEPRRVAARAAASRLAHLAGDEVGGLVGCTTRDDRRRSGRTRIEVVTDGILTRRLQRDPALTGVAGVIFDEFHERRLESDLGLALTLDVRRSIRTDLRILVMSATVDADRVAALLGGGESAPVVRSDGRLHDVDIRWRPTDLPVGRRRGRALAPPVAAAVDEALRGSSGDVLTFLPGFGEIRATAEALGGRPGVDVRPLHGSMSRDEQDAALGPTVGSRRKVVLSTDIAQTSLTVEGVTAVVDAGMDRRPAYSPSTGTTRLETVAASQAAATQRAGRAGRLGPGIAVRLWSEGEHARRRAFDDAEILLVDLAGFVLEVAAWGAGVDDLALLDPPPAPARRTAEQLLVALGALDTAGRLTELGRDLVGFPAHPRAGAIARSAAPAERTVACRIAALLEEGDVVGGRPGTVDADVGVRLRTLEDRRSGPRVAAVLHRASELERRLPRRWGDRVGVGPLLAAGYPDRIARRRDGQRGRFVLRSGQGARVGPHDALGDEPFLAVAQLDDEEGDSWIRLAAPLASSDVDTLAGDDIVVDEHMAWDAERGDLLVRRERRLGAIVLSRSESPAPPGPESRTAWCEVIREHGLELLAPRDDARLLRARVGFLREQVGADWPDVSDEALVDAIDEWWDAFGGHVTRAADLGSVDLAAVVRGRLDPEHHRRLDVLAPERLELPSGRRARIRYEAGAPPRVVAKVQEVFGLRRHPRLAGVPVLFDLRSPADRTVQLTADLPGFWEGSWLDVRRELAGRYPKHAWPERPEVVPERDRVRTRRTDT